MRNQPPSASLLPQTYIRQKIDVQVVDLCDKALAAVEKYKFLELQHDAITPKYPDPSSVTRCGSQTRRCPSPTVDQSFRRSA